MDKCLSCPYKRYSTKLSDLASEREKKVLFILCNPVGMNVLFPA